MNKWMQLVLFLVVVSVVSYLIDAAAGNALSFLGH